MPVDASMLAFVDLVRLYGRRRGLRQLLGWRRFLIDDRRQHSIEDEHWFSRSQRNGKAIGALNKDARRSFTFE